MRVTAALTIGMLDQGLWRRLEPGTPAPRARLEAVRALNDAGIPTGVMLAPVMPGMSDDPECLDALVDAAVAAGATHVTPIVLHLRPGVREVFWPWLEREHPELIGRYRALYRHSNAPKAYRERISEAVRRARVTAVARHGRPRAADPWPNLRRPPRGPDPAHVAGAQLSLL